jgi:hypothetical protein
MRFLKDSIISVQAKNEMTRNKYSGTSLPSFKNLARFSARIYTTVKRIDVRNAASFFTGGNFRGLTRM